MSQAPKKKPGRPPKPEKERAGNFSVRLPPELRGRIEAAADTAARSVNADIVARLEESFEWRVALPAELKDRLTQAALHANRTLEAEVARRLATSFDSLETVTFANRTEELRLVQQEIQSHEKTLAEIREPGVAPEDYVRQVERALARLMAHRDRLNEDMKEVIESWDQPLSVLGSLELDIDEYERIGQKK
ncbi:Arc family DNA-binding protein [Xanthomonas translucens pv. graminis]|uniref:Arc family DNA-binding protein n=1 Tax=Xanthomonas graminis TaxID=3390026 RepID=UPI00253FC6D0|nr:Arc family DNA-binding protein [Xanthomonas translucens]WIH05523.1 Arc family DNA-binding protein [Xanthomonas translucens pv. graminis]